MTNPSALYLPGATTEFVSTPDHASIAPGATDLSVIFYGALTNWGNASLQTLVSKRDLGANNFQLFVQSNNLVYQANGTNYTSTSSLSIGSGESLWVGITHDDSLGELKFWSSSDGSTWTQLGSTVSSVASLITGSGQLTVGRSAHTAINPLTATVYYAAVYNGIGDNSAPGLGTLVAELRTDAPIEPRYRDSTGKIWTLNGSAYSFVEVS